MYPISEPMSWMAFSYRCGVNKKQKSANINCMVSLIVLNDLMEVLLITDCCVTMDIRMMKSLIALDVRLLRRCAIFMEYGASFLHQMMQK